MKLRHITLGGLGFICLFLFSGSLSAQQLKTDPRLQQVYSSNLIWNGIALSSNGRAFVNYMHVDKSPGLSVGEMLESSQVKPYPDASWNNWKPGSDARHKFVRTNSLRFGPDGYLWVLDTGEPMPGGPDILNGPKLVAIDVNQNKVVRTIPLDKLVNMKKSFLDDLRFNGENIYVTDAGDPGLLVVNQKTGIGRRVLDGDKSTTDSRPMVAEGKIMVKQGNKQERIHNDQHEVTADGKWYYFQPASGPMWKVETRFLDDPKMSSADIARQVKFFYNTPTTGGTCIDAAGNLYVTDADHLRILKITPQGKGSVFIQDPRLLWADALYIDDKGYMWIPANQQNRIAMYNAGTSKVHYPVYIYKMKTGLKPVRR